MNNNMNKHNDMNKVISMTDDGDQYIEAGFPHLPKPGHWKALRHSSCSIVKSIFHAPH